MGSKQTLLQSTLASWADVTTDRLQIILIGVPGTPVPSLDGGLENGTISAVSKHLEAAPAFKRKLLQSSDTAPVQVYMTFMIILSFNQSAHSS